MAIQEPFQRKFDVIVWGASGFVGRLIAEHLFVTYGVNGTLRWAMAGRQASKLESVRASLGPGADVIPIVIADSHQKSTLEDMASSARVVCSAVGPYADYGSELIEVCIQAGTDYCDLSGETHWIRWMIDAHEAAAREHNVRIVNCCGLDSVPSDLGTLFVQNSMKARHGVYSPEVSMRLVNFKNAELSGGTYASILNAMAMVTTNRSVRKQMMDPNALMPEADNAEAPATDVNLPRWEHEVGAWVAPFMMATINSKVVRRSNALAGFPYGHDFRYGEGEATGPGLKGWLLALGKTLALTWFMLFTIIGPTRFILRRLLPSPGDGPDRETRESGSYEILFTARHPGDPAHTVQATVTGDRDPGYGSSSRMIGECAVCLALDDAPRSVPGGFWTPATCLGESLIKRLQSHAGIDFKIKDQA